ncbi:MAG: ATP synthase F0 subunit C [Clostridia bacterium]|nr:ATP synthase F0 subunit C [Clostridia bacterium]
MNLILLAEEVVQLSQYTDKSIYAIAAAIAILVAAAAAIAMGFAISKAIDAIARQPEADKKISSTLMIGLVFIETCVIYALVIAILIVINIL